MNLAMKIVTSNNNINGITIIIMENKSGGVIKAAKTNNPIIVCFLTFFNCPGFMILNFTS